MSDDLFYVGIADPVEVRKNLLSCSKKVITALKRYENFYEEREKKIELMIELRKVIKEIMFLNGKLKTTFPKTSLRALGAEKTKFVEKGKARSVKRKQVRAVKEEGELYKLEEELASIEEKLGALE